MLSIIVGLLIVALSVAGIYRWSCDVAVVLRGVFPLLFLVGGILVVLVGISGIRDDVIQEEMKKRENK